MSGGNKKNRGRPRVPLPKAPSTKPQGEPGGPLRTPKHLADPGANKGPYVVDRILSMCLKKGAPYYTVRWAGLPAACDTIEPAEHLCDEASIAAIAQYKAGREALDASASASASTACDTTGDEVAIVQEIPSNEPGRLIKRRGGSSVWQYFLAKFKEPDTGHAVTRCKLCDYVMCACNTSNLRTHLTRHHSGHLIKDSLTGESVSILTLE